MSAISSMRSGSFTPCRQLSGKVPAGLSCVPVFSSRCSRQHRRQAVNCGVTRRDGLAAIALAPLAPLLLSTGAAHAEPAQGQVQQYIDTADSFQLSLPANWEQSVATLPGNSSFQGSSGARRTLVWYPSDMPADQVNVTLTITNTSAEFTKLGSFGNVFAFGTNLVNSMDRSFLLRVRGARGANSDEPIQVAKLLDAAEKRGMYYVEYTVEKQPGPKRHLYSLVALSYNGRYNRLYTLNAQCLEEQVTQVEPVLQQVLKSFMPPAGAV